jgi:hypothetical protein
MRETSKIALMMTIQKIHKYKVTAKLRKVENQQRNLLKKINKLPTKTDQPHKPEEEENLPLQIAQEITSRIISQMLKNLRLYQLEPSHLQ